MLTSTTITFFLTASIASLSLTSATPTPIQHVRAVKELNQVAFKEAHTRDAGATRDFAGVPIKTSDGKCLFVDQLSGDFRANLLPIQVAACDGSQAQAWDIISKGKHNNAVGKTIVVNTLTQGCLDLNKGRVGKEVSIFSCGGRADGSGETSRDELFSVKAGSFPLTTDAAAGTCLTVTGNVVLPAPCVAGSATQTFSLGANGPAAIPQNNNNVVISSTKFAVVSTSAAAQLPAGGTACAGNTFVTVTRDVTVTVFPSSAGAVVSTTALPAISTSAAQSSTTTSLVAKPTAVAPPAAPAPAPPAQNPAPPAAGNPTTPVPVSRAGGVLNPTLAAEAHTRDNTATRAATGVSIKAPNGQCLFVDPTAGDFRQNLIPIAVRDCTGAAGEKFDLITKGIHNNAVGKTLIVSSLMNGCLNFDSRRAAGDRVLMFSCGGRAAGEGLTSEGQLWDFTGGNTVILTQQLRADPRVCLVPGAGKLGDVQNAAANCGGAATFTIG